MIYLTLFAEFFKIGLFAIGGGLATLPFLYDLADRYPWFDSAMLADMIAVSESTPGPVGINMATYAGYRAAGIGGGIVATVALVLPSLVIITIIANFLDKFNENKFVKYAFEGLRPAVVGLIAVASFEVFKIAVLQIELFVVTKNVWNLFDLRALILFVLFAAAIYKWKKHPIFYIGAGAVLGMLLGL